MPLRAWLVVLVLGACGERTAEGRDALEDAEVVGLEVTDGQGLEVEDTSEVVDAIEVDADPLPLEDAPGIGVALVSIELDPSAPGPLSFVVDVQADDLGFTIGEGPSFHRIPAPGDVTPRSRAGEAPWSLTPGERRVLDRPRLVAWAPGVAALDVAMSARSGELTLFSETRRIAPGTPSLLRIHGADITLELVARTGLPALPPDTRIGLTLDGTLAQADLAARVAGPLAVKHYAGARRWLLRPGCDSDAQCAEGGASFPCVSRCACACDEVTCDCDFSELEAVMQSEALATARALVGDDPAQLPRSRVHWVFKRSLGGTASCDRSGELDVSPATWRRFFSHATAAAIAINTRLGFRLIDILSPMNEANHPLQDGAHRNGAGQATLGGILPFAEVIHRTTCSAARCCAPDRYIVDDPDVPALSAAAMAGAMEVLAGADPTLAPEVALSLYLDVEQVDPLQLDAAGARPSIVTPVRTFMTELLAALGGAPFPDALLVADTYPGSWGAPWFETEDGIVHHMDPASRRIVRVDPVAAADAAIARALAAADDFAAVVGRRPRVLLGEVGWSTFDGDEDAQAAFARRLFDVAAAARADDPAFAGFLWFKTRDRTSFAYPTWDSAPNPIDGSEVTCDTRLLGPIACTADVLTLMEGQWGLTRADGTRKAAWERLLGRWARAAP